MATSSEIIKTTSIVSLLGLLMFSFIWMFVSGAVVSMPPHSLRSHLLEMGRPIQAVAIDLDADVGEPNHGVSAPGLGSAAPRALVAAARPVAVAIQQLTQPVPAVPATLDPEVSYKDAAKKEPRAVAGSKGDGPQARSGESKRRAQAKEDRTPPHQAKSKSKESKKLKSFESKELKGKDGHAKSRHHKDRYKDGAGRQGESVRCRL